MATRIVSAIAAAMLVAVAHTLIGLSNNNVLIIVAGAALCALPYGLWTLIETEGHPNLDLYLPGAATLFGVVLGALWHWTAQSSEVIVVESIAVLMAAVGSGTIILYRLRQRLQRCSLCRSHLGDGYQRCPRCENAICGHIDCWNAEFVRCSDCDWLGRPLFPDDEDWWLERLGPRVPHGRCIGCNLVGTECTMHKCGQCPWPMCTRCWDRENGRCVRCGWIMVGLPKSLQSRVYVQEPDRPSTSAGIVDRKRIKYQGGSGGH